MGNKKKSKAAYKQPQQLTSSSRLDNVPPQSQSVKQRKCLKKKKEEVKSNVISSSIDNQDNLNSNAALLNRQEQPPTATLKTLTLSPDKLVYKLDSQYIAQQQQQQALMIVSSPKQVKQQVEQTHSRQQTQSINRGQSTLQSDSLYQSIASPPKQTALNNQSQSSTYSTSAQHNHLLELLQLQQQPSLQSSQVKNIQAQAQFQHLNQQVRQVMPHQVGINGLLNMTKQRVLVNQSVNKNQQQQVRSQSSQKNQSNQFQSNGKIIASKPQVYPHSIYSDIQKQQHPQYHLSQSHQQQQQQQPQGFSIVPAGRYNQQHLQLLSGLHLSKQNGATNLFVLHKGMQQKNNSHMAQAQQYFFQDLPVSVNGRQIGVPNNSHNYLRVDPRNNFNFKKGGSAGYLNSLNQYDMYQQRQLLLDYHAQSFNNELSRQAMVHEVMDGQNPNQDASQMSRSQLFQSMMQVNSQNQPSQEDTIRRVRETAIPHSVVPRKSKIPFANAYVEDCYKFIVVPGNNSGLIRKALERRDWWIEIPPVHSLYNFKWQPVSYGIKFERLSPVKPKMGEIGSLGAPETTSSSNDMVTKQMVNHFEFHQLITEKANLFHQLKTHCEAMKENIFDICPLTFYIEVTDADKSSTYQQSLQQFINVYQQFEENKERMKQIELQISEHKQKLMSKENEGEKDEEEQDNQQTAASSGDQSSNSQNKEQNAREREFLNQLNNKGPQGQTMIGQGKVTKFKTFNFDKRASTKYTCPLSHFNGYNLWLLKPTHLNRGRGIHVFRDLDDLHRLIKEYTHGKDEEVKVSKKQASTVQNSPMKNDVKAQQLQQDLNESQDLNELNDREDSNDEDQDVKKKGSPKKNNLNGCKIKHNTFIIQKYIEKPLLLYGRKFDIRVWVLLNQDYDLFMFKEGYLRTSSSEFKINLKNVDDQYVHLTNNAVQKYSEHYGNFEDGNQLGYKRFQEILDEQATQQGDAKCHVSVKDDLVPQMKELIVKSMQAVRKKIDPHRRKYCFELFGYDFILDADYNMWLIEINTNPCIEESSELLKVYLPRMIEDMLRLTIDQIFPKIRKGGKGKKYPGSPQKHQSRPKQPSQASIPQPQSALDRIEEDALEHQQVNQDRPQTQEQEELKHQEQPEPPKKQCRIHPVEGYSNTENMWEKLWNLDRAETPTSKYNNFRSEFVINVNKKQFKIKKNPLYKRVVKEIAAEIESAKKDQ